MRHGLIVKIYFKKNEWNGNLNANLKEPLFIELTEKWDSMRNMHTSKQVSYPYQISTLASHITHIEAVSDFKNPKTYV